MGASGMGAQGRFKARDRHRQGYFYRAVLKRTYDFCKLCSAPGSSAEAHAGVPRETWEPAMYALALLVIALSGYAAFEKTRQGANLGRSIGEALLVSAMINGVLSGASLWLSGAAPVDIVQIALGVVVSSFAAALVGAFSAGLRPQREASHTGRTEVASGLAASGRSKPSAAGVHRLQATRMPAPPLG